MSHSGLTDDEREVLDRLAEAWNLFIKLPQQHPDHLNEFRTLIHHAQRVVMSRPISRDEGWIKASQPHEFLYGSGQHG